LQTKWANADEPTFDYHKLKVRLTIGFWVMFAVYSCYWGAFYWVSLDKYSLVYVDLAVSAYFAFLIVLYLIRGTKLIKVMN